jgi:hypothetical protein
MVRTLKARTLRTARLKAYPEKDIFISREALAERWDVHVETIKRDEKNGRLQPIRIGDRRIRYRLDDILAIENEAGIAGRSPAAAKAPKAAIAGRAAKMAARRAAAAAVKLPDQKQ